MLKKLIYERLLMETTIEKQIKKLTVWKLRIEDKIKQLEEKYGQLQAVNSDHIEIFLEQLKSMNYRDYLVARVIIETRARISQIVTLKKSSIDFNEKKIVFIYRSEIVHTSISQALAKELEEHANKNSSEYMFVTCNNKPLTRGRLNIIFSEASKRTFPVIDPPYTCEKLRLIKKDAL